MHNWHICEHRYRVWIWYVQLSFITTQHDETIKNSIAWKISNTIQEQWKFFDQTAFYANGNSWQSEFKYMKGQDLGESWHHVRHTCPLAMPPLVFPGKQGKERSRMVTRQSFVSQAQKKIMLCLRGFVLPVQCRHRSIHSLQHWWRIVLGGNGTAGTLIRMNLGYHRWLHKVELVNPVTDVLQLSMQIKKYQIM